MYMYVHGELCLVEEAISNRIFDMKRHNITEKVMVHMGNDELFRLRRPGAMEHMGKSSWRRSLFLGYYGPPCIS